MIIIDLNQIVISNIMAQVGKHTNVPIDINLVRHMVLNQIRYLRTKFKAKFGNELVIAVDGRHYWRKDVFPYYKANRSKQRKESDFDWNTLFECLNTLRAELDEFMPYTVIHNDKAEADDIISTIVKRKGVVLCGADTERILIVSGDGDFAQLQKFLNVDQFDMIRDKFIVVTDPSKYLREHIIKGDTGDGIPNIMSPDNSLADGIRQKKITAKILEAWMVQDENTVEFANYKRNRQLIDLTQIPEWLEAQIWSSYTSQQNKPRDKMFNYFVNNRLSLLLTHLQDF